MSATCLPENPDALRCFTLNSYDQNTNPLPPGTTAKRGIDAACRRRPLDLWNHARAGGAIRPGDHRRLRRLAANDWRCGSCVEARWDSGRAGKIKNRRPHIRPKASCTSPPVRATSTVLDKSNADAIRKRLKKLTRQERGCRQPEEFTRRNYTIWKIIPDFTRPPAAPASPNPA